MCIRDSLRDAGFVVYLKVTADEAVCIGPAQANKSYLIMANIIACLLYTSRCV